MYLRRFEIENYNGLTEVGRWDGMVAKLSSRFTGQYTNLGSTLGSFSDNPMGRVAANRRSLAGAVHAAATKYLRCDVCWHANGEAQ